MHVQTLPQSSLLWRTKEVSAVIKFESGGDEQVRGARTVMEHTERPYGATKDYLSQDDHSQRHVKAQVRRARRGARKENIRPEAGSDPGQKSRTDSRPGLNPSVDDSAPSRETHARQLQPCGLRVRTEVKPCAAAQRQKRTVPRSAIRGVLRVSIHRERALIHVHIQEVHRLPEEQRPHRLKQAQRHHKHRSFQGCYVQVCLTSDPLTQSRTGTLRSRIAAREQRFTLCVGCDPDVRSRLVLSLIRSHPLRSERCTLIGCMSFGVNSLVSKPVSGWFYFLSPRFGWRKHLRGTSPHTHAAAEHTAPSCVNPASLESSRQSESKLTSGDGRAAPKEHANASYRSTRCNANLSAKPSAIPSANVSAIPGANFSANPGTDHSGNLRTDPGANLSGHPGIALGRADSGSLTIVILRGPDGFGFTIFSDCPVRVQDVDSGGPAHSAGLRHGDVILQLNSVSVETWGCGQLAHAIRSCPAHITLVIWRPTPETTPAAWPHPPLQQSETTKALQAGPEHRRRGQTSLWRRSQDREMELNANQLSREEQPLSRNMLSGFGGEDYILLSPMEHSLSVGRATTIGRWYHPPPSSRSSYASATLPPPLAKSLGCYGDYENCTIVQSHICTNDFGSIAPKTLIFPIHLKPIDLCSPDRTLLLSEDLLLHQPDLLPAKVTVMVYNDLLLFTKEDEIGRYNILQSPVYLDTVSFIEVSSKPLHLFFLRTARGSVQFSLEAYSLQQKHRLSICLHDNMQHLVSMETQRLSLHDNIPTGPEPKQPKDSPSDPLTPPLAPPSSRYSPVWKVRCPGEQRSARTNIYEDLNPTYKQVEDRAEELRLDSDINTGLRRSLSEGSLLQEPRSPQLLTHSPVLTWPLRAGLGPDNSNTPRPSVQALKKHLTEGGSLQRALELLYGTKALEMGQARLKKRTRNLVSLAFLQRRKTNGNFNSNSLEKALRNNRPATEQVHRWSQSLEALLTNQYGLAVFRHFLRSEFSEENLDFWLAVEKFKRTGPQKMVSKATRIYNEFISSNATRQVNIDSAVRELTNQSLSLRISPSSFQLAQDHIYNLMLTDSYPRFLKSRLYSQLANQNQHQSQTLP